MAKLRGATVIGTVSTDAKAEDARAAGCDEVVVYGATYEFRDDVRRLAPRGVDVVYDSVGRATADASLASLRPRGTCVLYGNSSGAPRAIAPTPTLAVGGSLFVTRPLLDHYLLTADEVQREEPVETRTRTF